MIHPKFTDAAVKKILHHLDEDPALNANDNETPEQREVRQQKTFERIVEDLKKSGDWDKAVRETSTLLANDYGAFYRRATLTTSIAYAKRNSLRQDRATIFFSTIGVPPALFIAANALLSGAPQTGILLTNLTMLLTSVAFLNRASFLNESFEREMAVQKTVLKKQINLFINFAMPPWKNGHYFPNMITKKCIWRPMLKLRVYNIKKGQNRHKNLQKNLLNAWIM